MGLFDQLKSETTGLVSQLAGEHPLLAQEVMALVQGSAGGLAGFAQQLQNRGLGSQVKSWIATGPNQPVTAQEIQQALGSERVKQLAARVGIDADVVAQKLSTILPQLIDRLTPNGQLPPPK
jgi:uncharacterized protein YidB (DUF937 family)